MDDDKIVLLLSFDKGVKDQRGYLYIENDALLFRGIEENNTTFKIPFAQIIKVKTCPKIYSYWGTWGHDLWITHKTEGESQKTTNFLLQRRAGVYGEEIKAKINRLIHGSGYFEEKCESAKLSPREQHVLWVYILTFPFTIVIGKFIFTNLPPFNFLKIEIGTYHKAIGTILGAAYLCGVYWIIRCIVRMVYLLRNK
jgi:hypothetical protein